VEGNILAQGRTHWRQGRAVEAVRRSGKFGARLTRLENAGFTAFIHLRNDKGVITRGEARTLGGSN
jgi:histidyl-tRNA synthetase